MPVSLTMLCHYLRHFAALLACLNALTEAYVPKPVFDFDQVLGGVLFGAHLRYDVMNLSLCDVSVPAVMGVARFSLYIETAEIHNGSGNLVIVTSHEREVNGSRYGLKGPCLRQTQTSLREDGTAMIDISDYEPGTFRRMSHGSMVCAWTNKTKSMLSGGMAVWQAQDQAIEMGTIDRLNEAVTQGHVMFYYINAGMVTPPQYLTQWSGAVHGGMSLSKPAIQLKHAYTKEMLEEALKDINQGMPIRAAGRLHNVPEATLRFRIRLTLPPGQPVTIGGPTFFSRQQEELLAEHLIYMAHMGYGLCKLQVLKMAAEMATAIGKETLPTKHWFYGFIRRFPELKMMKPVKREKARETAVTQDMLDNYFRCLDECLLKYDVKNKAAHLWNVDETGISLEHSPPKIVAAAGTRPFYVTSGRQGNTTVIAAGSALGETIPPYIILKGERLPSGIQKQGIKGTQYRMSDSGWSNSELFEDFFQNHFLKHVKVRPCILFYDGHVSHVQPSLIHSAKEEGIALFVLPPHSTHCLQPLDVTVFGALKQALNSEFHTFMTEHPNSIVTKEHLPLIIASAYKSAMLVKTIMAGYRKSGIFPFAPEAPAASLKLPCIAKKVQQKTTRRQRKEDRAVRVLIDGKQQEFNKLKGEVKQVSRKRAVPSHGAEITEEGFEVTRKKAKKFQPPPPAIPSQGEDTEEDDNCAVCGRWQPEGLRLDRSLKIVEWGCCDVCKKWIHLKFCTNVEKLLPKDAFVCPNCLEE